LVPSFISDEDLLLFHASIVVEQDDRDAQPIIGPLLPPTGLSLVPYKDSDEESADVVEVSGPITPSGSKKRRAMKLKTLFTRGHPSGQALQLFSYFPCCPSPLCL
jgi:hypothetical protein